MWLASSIQPNLSSGEAVGSRHIPNKPGSWRFELDGFMTPWWFDAFGSGSFASKCVGFIGPTMVLSETRGLQLFGLCEGAYGAFGGSVLNDSTRGLTHRLILSLDPERRKNRLAKPSGK